jgi:hypothetical protein
VSATGGNLCLEGHEQVNGEHYSGEADGPAFAQVTGAATGGRPDA